LGAKLLVQLTISDIRSLIDGIEKSATTKAHIKACLHKALEDAVNERLIDSNPSQRVQAPLRYDSSEVNPLTSEELDKLLSASHIPFYPLVVTAALTGARPEELFALQWKNLDLEGRILRIERSVQSRNGKSVFSPCKNRQARSVILFEFNTEVLRRHREVTYTDPECLIFCRDGGQVLYPSVVTRNFSKSLRQLGLRHVRFYDLRHTHATQLLMAGVPLKVAQERLGHQTAKMTLDLYGHFVPGLQEKFIRGLDSRFLPETANKAGTPGATRTPDTRFRKPLLYPSELQGHATTTTCALAHALHKPF
jgi:integrase